MGLWGSGVLVLWGSWVLGFWDVVFWGSVVLGFWGLGSVVLVRDDVGALRMKAKPKKKMVHKDPAAAAKIEAVKASQLGACACCCALGHGVGDCPVLAQILEREVDERMDSWGVRSGFSASCTLA